MLLTTLGMAKPDARVTPQDRKEMRLVFLVSPGPGGGGGGGGHREPAPPPPAERKGVAQAAQPDPGPASARLRMSNRRRPWNVAGRAASQPVKAEPLPPVVAPSWRWPRDPRDRAGVPWRKRRRRRKPTATAPARAAAPGAARAPASAKVTARASEPGSGGGTGGGPYRPGAGITAPAILREVKPDYTEEGRRRQVEGDVVLEIVVRRDGSVGSVKLLQGLGAGLDQRAIDAVRQWRFSPAKRYGVPVDVMVEVAMEFKLR